MNWIRYYIIYFLSFLWRFFPMPIKTGIITIGSPNQDSPVIVTGNYILTVEILKKEFRNNDLYLLVANSRGINVWCAATGGHFTDHDVISVLKSTGIGDLVKHRTYYLPQLAATGIEPRNIYRKTGWRGIWGPVYARDLLEFIDNDNAIDRKNRDVEFTLSQRMEMAVTWSVLMSVIYFMVLIWFSLHLTLILLLNSWVLSFAMFILFPYYLSLIQLDHNHWQTLFSRIAIILLFSPFEGVGIYLGYLLYNNLSQKEILVSIILSTVIILSLLSDLKGNTPIFKSDFHPDRLFDIKINPDKCREDRSCIQVCPKNCLEIDDANSKAIIPRKDDCVQCGACIVQCPFDALFFENKNGERLTPQIVRQYKLNLMGKRARIPEQNRS